ncbi:MAG: hypothetical protein IPL97_13715 [Niastella sp.]|nr:hypothetical protein [Niastella sp.]
MAAQPQITGRFKIPVIRAITSNDATQFIVSSSDAQGLGSTTLTTLISPAFSLQGCTAATLEFWHYYQDLGSLGRVDYSIDGGVTLGAYTHGELYQHTGFGG